MKQTRKAYHALDRSLALSCGLTTAWTVRKTLSLKGWTPEQKAERARLCAREWKRRQRALKAKARPTIEPFFQVNNDTLSEYLRAQMRRS